MTPVSYHHVDHHGWYGEAEEVGGDDVAVEEDGEEDHGSASFLIVFFTEI